VTASVSLFLCYILLLLAKISFFISCIFFFFIQRRVCLLPEIFACNLDDDFFELIFGKEVYLGIAEKLNHVRVYFIFSM
jgi:hypothetical protein